jgi:hypothetical protein
MNRDAPLAGLSDAALRTRHEQVQREEDRKQRSYQTAMDRKRQYYADHRGQSSKAVKDMRARLTREEDELYDTYMVSRREAERILVEIHRRSGYVARNNDPGTNEEEEGVPVMPGPNVPRAPDAPVPIPAGFEPVAIPAPDMATCGREDHLTGEDYDPARTVMLSDNRCYSYEFIIQLYNTAARGRRPFISPFTRQAFTPRDVAIVLTLKQQLRLGGARTRKHSRSLSKKTLKFA